MISQRSELTQYVVVIAVWIPEQGIRYVVSVISGSL